MDIDIISQLETLLNIKLNPMDHEFLSARTLRGYTINSKNQVTRLHLVSIGLETISPMVPYIQKLSALEHLNLSNNIIRDISLISKVTQLTSLNLTNNKIEDITPLKKLDRLTSLLLGRNMIRDLSPLSNLTKLARLSISFSEKSKMTTIDLSPLEKLDLRHLNILNASVSHEDVIGKFKRLTHLTLVSTNISNISWMSTLKELKDLNLYDNNITNINPIKDLKRLKLLMLQSNPIEVVPAWIVEFNMRIAWSEFGQAGAITFYENPIKNPPISTIKRGKPAIVRHFNRVKSEGFDYLYEAKLTLVGEGNAGKTSLQVRLLNAKSALPQKDKRTRGIKIIDWKFKKNKGDKHIAHIWDFGGQDVYYPVHRFFLTENSVFVLLASTRQTHHNFDYWIPTIYQFGGKSPIILGQTCHEGNKAPWNDLGYYMSNINFNIVKTLSGSFYHEINLPRKNEGLTKIKKAIIDQIVNLPHYGKGVPKSWIPVRNTIAIESKHHACISFDRFKQICKESNPERFAHLIDIEDCASFFHSIGVILWYYDNTELRNWVVLQPEWAMNAVYKIIDDEAIQKRNGNILDKDFVLLWKDACYEDKHSILKKMLSVFKIAFPKKHNKGEYIIPARLLSMPAEAKWTDNEQLLRLEYRYEFMPKGLVNQISAELSRYIANDEHVWNNAVNFNYKNEAECQIEEDFYNRRISIKAKGKNARDLITIIMHTMQDITEGYKGVQPAIQVPCMCNICKNTSKPTTFLYDDLIRWNNRVNAFVTCNESGDNLIINELLYNIGVTPNDNNKQKSLKVFVSYSKFDEDYLQDFEEHLVTMKEEGLVSFNCREIEFGKEWDKEIKKQIDECDVMICLVSIKFLNTSYIKKIEIAKAIEQNKIIIPIIIKACDWETSKLGKYQAAQRGKIVSLDNNNRLVGKIKGHTEEEKAAFWTAIVKELRKKLIKDSL